MNAAIIGSFVRWFLTVGAAHSLFTDLNPSQLSQAADAIVLLGTLGWSVWIKRHQR